MQVPPILFFFFFCILCKSIQNSLFEVPISEMAISLFCHGRRDLGSSWTVLDPSYVTFTSNISKTEKGPIITMLDVKEIGYEASCGWFSIGNIWLLTLHDLEPSQMQLIESVVYIKFVVRKYHLATRHSCSIEHISSFMLCFCHNHIYDVIITNR